MYSTPTWFLVKNFSCPLVTGFIVTRSYQKEARSYAKWDKQTQTDVIGDGFYTKRNIITLAARISAIHNECHWLTVARTSGATKTVRTYLKKDKKVSRKVAKIDIFCLLCDFVAKLRFSTALPEGRPKTQKKKFNRKVRQENSKGREGKEAFAIERIQRS